MASQWYCLTDDEEGPLTFQELARRLATGELLPGDLVRREESSDWRRADAIFGLMKAARQITKSATRATAPHPSGWLGKALLTRCERLFPALPAERLLASVCLLLVVTFAGEVFWYWSQQPVRFPAPPENGITQQGPDRLHQLRPVHPPTPTLPELPRGIPTLVPGFEQIHWMKSPALSADLLTIIYVGYAGEGQLDDLMMAVRESPEEPFHHHHPLRKLNSTLREAHPCLSPDGRELVFSRLGTPTTLWIARRENRSEPFSVPHRLILKNDPDQDQHHDAAHYLTAQLLCVTIGDIEFKERRQWLAVRDSRGTFTRTTAIPITNPWPRYYLTAAGKRAFLPTESGLLITARARNNIPFEEPEILFGTTITGPDLTTSDDTLWVAPAEDVLFYCGPGPTPTSDGSRHLWMIRQ